MDSLLIHQSNLACRDLYHLNPYDLPIPKTRLSPKALKEKRQVYFEIRQVSNHFVSKLLDLLEGTPILLAISDEEGFLLDTIGDKSIQALINKVGFYPGVLFTEQDVGTNSISLALSREEPVQVIGDDHYHYILKKSACFSVPFSFTQPYCLKGTLSIMTSVEYESGLSLGLLSTVVDSIERELLLRHKNKQLHILNHVVIDSTLNGILVTNDSGDVTEFNPFAEKITGVTKQNLVGCSVSYLKELSPFIYKVLHQGMVVQNEHVNIVNKQTGEIKWCLLDAEPIRNVSQEIVGAYAQFRDLTERRMIEEKLQTVGKLSSAGKMSAGIAHEIKNPLTPIKGFLQLLERKFEHQSEEAHYLRLISMEIERINGLVNQFGQMAKPTLPQMNVEKLTPILLDTITLMNTQARIHDVEISFDGSVETEVNIDQNQIKQVLQNLIQNAIESMAGGGRIDVRQYEEVDTVIIEIKDQGCGIPNEIISKLAVPFKTTKLNGLGIGLSICYDILKSHQGKLQALHNEWGGTTFKMYLPKQKGQ